VAVLSSYIIFIYIFEHFFIFILLVDSAIGADVGSVCVALAAPTGTPL
jgi:hypothetical protein